MTTLMLNLMTNLTRGLLCSALSGALAAVPAGIACADETVNVGGSNAVLLRPQAPHGSIILMPGGNGAISPGPNGEINGLRFNQLVRTRHAYMARGFAVHVVDAGADLAS